MPPRRWTARCSPPLGWSPAGAPDLPGPSWVLRRVFLMLLQGGRIQGKGVSGVVADEAGQGVPSRNTGQPQPLSPRGPSAGSLSPEALRGLVVPLSGTLSTCGVPGRLIFPSGQTRKLRLRQAHSLAYYRPPDPCVLPSFTDQFGKLPLLVVAHPSHLFPRPVPSAQLSQPVSVYWVWPVAPPTLLSLCPMKPRGRALLA